MGLLNSVLKSFSQLPNSLFSKELFLFNYKDFGNKPKPNTYMTSEGASGKLLKLRNSLAHGATLSEEESEATRQDYELCLLELLVHSNFLADLELIFVEPQSISSEKTMRLLTLSIKNSIKKEVPIDFGLVGNHVYINKKNSDDYLDLYPLLIYTLCKELKPVLDSNGKTESLKHPCGQEKVLIFNDQKDRIIAFLDYWKGHHSNFGSSELLPEDFRAKFPPIYRQAKNNDEPDWFDVFIANLTENFVGRESDILFLNNFINQTIRNVLA